MPFTHYVMIKLAATDADDRAAKAKLLKETIEGMDGQVPGLNFIKVGIDVLHTEKSADVIVHSQFADREAERLYQTHPAHEAVKKVVHPLLAPGGILAVDYDEE